MGMMIDGVWTAHPPEADGTGAFARKATNFHGQITADGSSPYRAEAGRYHLYVSLACPWAHRTLIFRKLKGLEAAISLSVVDPFMGEDGWHFSDGPGCIADRVTGSRFMRDIYAKARPDYTGRVSVPVLWDIQSETIVNNESAEIIRMFNSEFDSPAADFYPADMRTDIDAVNAVIYNTVNNGVYKCGFATRQEPYDQAVAALFATLDDLEARLDGQRYLCGDRLTEADWRLFTTLLRFDPVYYGHFKCNIRRLIDYPNLWNYTRELYLLPGVAETCNLDHIKRHYYKSHETVNPTRIVPKGPDIDFAAPHNRERLPGKTV
jgi:glutathionyl-hydroquinone reductase